MCLDEPVLKLSFWVSYLLWAHDLVLLLCLAEGLIELSFWLQTSGSGRAIQRLSHVMESLSVCLRVSVDDDIRYSSFLTH